MADIMSPEERSKLMSRIRSKNTVPELMVRSVLHRLGYRFRLHRRDLPGVPDVVLPKLKTVIFVHGCFWHRHKSCKFAYVPKSRKAFWKQKFHHNIQRDKEVKHNLQRQGWCVRVIWECETFSEEKLEKIIRKFVRR